MNKDESLEIKKVLVIRMSSIGDVILTSPLIRELRRAYPDVQIDFLVRSEYVDLVKYDKNLSYIYQYDVKTKWKGLRALKSFIREQDYDIIMDLHSNFRSFYLRSFSPQPLILKVNKNLFLRFLLIKFKINLYKKFYGEALSVAQKYLRAGGNFDYSKSSLKLKLSLPRKISQKGKIIWKSLEDENFRVIVAPGARHQTKRWPLEYYIELILKIYHQYGWNSLLVGSFEEILLIKDIQKQVGNGITEITAGDISLIETASLIKQAPLFISNDSGLMHVAAAYRKPQIAIFGSTTKELGFFPLNPKAVIVESLELRCRPCTHIGREACPKKHFKCMKEVTPEMVFSVFQKMVEQNKLQPLKTL